MINDFFVGGRLQRLQKIVSTFSKEEQQHLNIWLKEQGQNSFLELDFGPKLKRHGLSAALA